MVRTPWPLAFALVLLLPLAGAADPDEAAELVTQAEEAMDEGSFKAAEALFRRAVEASEACVPAHVGLGEALLEQERTDDAVVAYRQAVRAARARGDLPAAWDRLLRKARRRLEKHDARGAKLEEAVDAYVEDLMKIATTYRRGDPDLADRVIDRVLVLRPQHERAREIRGRMAERGSRKQAIFDGKQIADWDGGRSSWWSVSGGAIVAKAKGVATYIRNQERIEGNFDVIMEARFTDRSGKAPFVALMAAWNAEFDHSRFGILAEALHWHEHRGKDDKERVFRAEVSQLRKVDPKAWTTYELRFREDKIHALINGQEVHSMDRPKERAGGFVGILAQDCVAEIRRLDVLHR